MGPKSTNTRTALKRDRRAAAAEVVAQAMAEGGASAVEEIIENPVSGWTEDHEKEVRFQRTKRRCIEREAFTAGHLLHHEVDNTIAQEARQQESTFQKNAAKLRRAAERQSLNVAAGGQQSLECWRKTRVHVDPAFRNDSKLAKAMGCLQMTMVPQEDDKLASVDVFVVPDVACPPDLVAFVAKIQGRTLMPPAVLKGERAGPIVAYWPALGMKRLVFLSDRFKAESSEAAGLLHTMVASGGSRWTLLDTANAFETAKAQAYRKKCNATVLGIFTDAEVCACNSLPPWMKNHIFTRGSFLEFVERLCLPRCNLGADQACLGAA